MKEVAYRFWNSSLSKMYSWPDVQFEKVGDVFLVDEAIKPLMWTGKQDVDSSDIYDGDVLLHEDDEGGVMLVVWDDYNARFRMDLYGYSVSTGENSQDVISEQYGLIREGEGEMADCGIYKIIGNIYENPELLHKL